MNIFKYDVSKIRSLPDEDIKIHSDQDKLRKIIKKREEETEMNSEYDMISLVEYFYKLRHDSLHYQLQKSLKINVIGEEKIVNIFPFIERNKNKTPDIVFVKDGNVFIIEISISSDFSASRHYKSKKYEDLIEELHENGVVCELCTVCISPTLNNLDQELQQLKLKIDINFQFDYNNFTSFHNYICDKIEQYTKKIPGEFLSWYSNNKSDKTKYTMRQNMLRKDIDIKIDPNISKNKYKYYENLNNVENDDIFTEDDLCEYLKEILENEFNPVNEKFKDIVNNRSKYDIAKHDIIEKTNKMKTLTDSKPTHHILVPVEDFGFNDDSEQQNIDELFNYIETFIDMFERPSRDDGRLDYLYNIIKEKNKIKSPNEKNYINNENNVIEH